MPVFGSRQRRYSDSRNAVRDVEIESVRGEKSDQVSTVTIIDAYPSRSDQHL